MKKVLVSVLLMGLGIGFFNYALAQAPAALSPVASAPAVVAPAVSAPAPALAPAAASSLLSAGFIAMIISIVACLNIALSAVQQVFSQLSKSEPGWLQSISSVVLAISKYLGSNPNV